MKTTPAKASGWLAAVVCVVVTIESARVSAEEAKGQRVTFTTKDSDAVQIVGDFHMPGDGGGKPPVAILLHMYKTERSTFQPLIAALTGRGIAALAIDLRGHGESIEPSSAQLAQRVEQRDRSLFKGMKHDVMAAYTWLAEQGQVDLSRFALVGASVGCTVAFQYAEEDRSVDVIVALSPGTNYMKIRSEPDFEKLVGRDILLISPEEEVENANALKKVNDKAEIKIVSGKTAEGGNIHGTRMYGTVEGIEEFIAGYIYSRLGSPPDAPVVSKLKGPFYIPMDDERSEKISAEDKRIYTNVEEAEARGLRMIGTRSNEAMGAVNI